MIPCPISALAREAWDRVPSFQDQAGREPRPIAEIGDRLGKTPCFLHRRSILVCGAPRTGTSWTAKVLSLGGGIRYFREPISHGGFAGDHGVSGFPFLPASRDFPAYEAAWRRVFSFEPLVKRRWLMGEGSPWIRRLPFWPARLLIKEVNCPLTLDWLARRFPLSVLITIRHPCGYVASGLRHHAAGERVAELDDLRSQPMLMAQFPERVRDWIMGVDDPVTQLAAAYGIIYKILGDQLIDHPEWLVIHHEALCRDPRAGFRRLCRGLGLRYTRAMDATIGETSNAHDTGRYSLRRMSAEVPEKWKSDLSSRQIEAVADAVSRFRLRFYRDFA